MTPAPSPATAGQAPRARPWRPGTGGLGAAGAEPDPDIAFAALLDALVAGDPGTARRHAGDLARLVSSGHLPCGLACLIADCQGYNGSEPRDDW